jgi:hypothetical protein
MPGWTGAEGVTSLGEGASERTWCSVTSPPKRVHLLLGKSNVLEPRALKPSLQSALRSAAMLLWPLAVIESWMAEWPLARIPFRFSVSTSCPVPVLQILKGPEVTLLSHA